jgi:hypothetical protein
MLGQVVGATQTICILKTSTEFISFEDHMGFYSSLAAVSRTAEDNGRRSYAATGYLRPNLHRPNLKVLTEALATKIVLEGKKATGVEFRHNGQNHTVKASKEVILSGGVINSPQLLELSGIGDPKILKKAGVECKVENKGVGANFQDHVLGGMLYDLKDGIQSLDSLHGAEYQKAQDEIYQKTRTGPYGSPGMVMGFVSYASLVSKETLEQTIAEIRKNSLAKTDFEKRQEEEIMHQLSKCFLLNIKPHPALLTVIHTGDPSFANIQTFCEPSPNGYECLQIANINQASAANSTSPVEIPRSNSSAHRRKARPEFRCSCAWSILFPVALSM